MEQVGTASGGHPNLNLTPEEKRVYGQLFKEADPDGFGAVSGDVAVKFFERTRLPPDVLGLIWQIADTENRGFLTPAGFGVVLRLIGHAQAGRAPSTTIAPSPAPLPKFEGGPPTQQPQQPQPPPQPQPVAQPIAQQNSGTPSSPTSGPPAARVPALGPDKVAEYSALFEKSGAENGLLSGLVAKQIFERARLPNEVLGRIWNLADAQGKGSLDVGEFVIAMHLLASYKSGAMRGVPNILPPGLLDAASRRPPARLAGPQGPQRPSSAAGQPVQPMPQHFTGQMGRPQSPIVRQQMGTPLSAQSTGEQWLIGPADKQRFDQVFGTIDTLGQGFISGDQAVQFFGNARLPEEVLAQIWDLADINSDGVLNRDEFAVAMFLIRQQRGSRDGRVPQTLPTGLVPPSMRKQQMPSQPSTVPVFDDAPVTKPRSAADDLFGLDVSENPPPQSQIPAQQQVAQSTGGTDAGPFANSKAAPGPSSSSPPPPSSTFFQPFVPKSSYGQGLVPGSAPNQGQQRSQPDRDLMDNDEDEAPAKINNDAAELGNLSNQVGNLSKQMTDLHSQRGQAEQELTQNANQKRAFQERLTTLRAAYDQEVKQVKSLKEQLATSQTETKRLQQDMAMIEGTHADLKTQHQQLSSALQVDQQENASLKERIRQTNGENEMLKPQLEKLKSEARQQKGLVAINKKQLATNETERDRIKAEIAAAQKELEDARRETEESARQVEASQRELERAKEIPIPAPAPREISPPPQVVSPAPSTASSNPFFRRQDSGAVFSPPMGSAITSPAPDHERNAAFDSIFGPSFGTAAPAPDTSFARSFQEPEARSETPRVVEPPAPEPANQIDSSALPLRTGTTNDSSTTSSVKVAPPASRLSPAHTPRALTPDTSTASPSSQRADDPFVASPVDQQQESVRQTLPRGDTQEKLGTIPGGFPEESRSSTPAINPTAVAVGAGAATIAAGAGIAAATVSTPDTDKGKAPAAPSTNDDFDSFFTGPSHKKTLSEQRADFDSAFGGFDDPAKTTTTTAPKAAARQEFPDIQELDDDDDDDDSSEESEEEAKGFDDNFAAPAPAPAATPSASQGTGKQPELASAIPSRLQAPPLESRVSSSSSLPGFDQQQSPPGYQDAVPTDNPNHFPPEFKNLLPEREDPTSPPPATSSQNLPGSEPAPTSPLYGPEVGQSRSVSHSEVIAPPPTKSAPFDFDSAFENLGQAPVAADDESDSDYDDRTPSALKHQPQSFDFDPSFDSPARSTQTTNTTQQPPSVYDAVTSPATNGAADSPMSSRNPNAFSDFDEFNSNPFPPSRTGTLQSQPTASPTVAAPPASHDWDALFAPLDSQGNASAPQASSGTGPTSPPVEREVEAPLTRTDTTHSVQQSTQIGYGLTATTTHEEVEDLTPPASQQQVPTLSTMPTSPPASAQSKVGPSSSAPKMERPKPGRALTEGTEHDDPILKSLTAMGWSRNESLAALERFDYNIDKAADYLTFKS